MFPIAKLYVIFLDLDIYDYTVLVNDGNKIKAVSDRIYIIFVYL